MTIFGKNEILTFFCPGPNLVSLGLAQKKMLPAEKSLSTYQVIIPKALPTHRNHKITYNSQDEIR